MKRFFSDTLGYIGGHFLNLAQKVRQWFVVDYLTLHRQVEYKPHCFLERKKSQEVLVSYNVLDCVLAVDLLSLSTYESSGTTYSASINLLAPFRCVSVGLLSRIHAIHFLQQHICCDIPTTYYISFCKEAIPESQHQEIVNFPGMKVMISHIFFFHFQF
ncbi:hypothetical protein ILYODFUR_034757 [Ilyodon furcidens]|uniref:Uncharacterized protein n=1 Tax=Ilyodon furcidens TaxID=33524 RepID=A0ABV0UXN4_9TELE